MNIQLLAVASQPDLAAAQRQRIVSEHLGPPAGKGWNIGLFAEGRDAVDVVAGRDHARRDIGVLGLHLQQHLQQVGDGADAARQVVFGLGFRAVMVGDGFARGDGVEDALAHRSVGRLVRKAARARQLGRIARLVRGDFDQGFVAQNPTAGQVAPLGLALSPRGQFAQDGEHAGFLVAHLQAGVGPLRVPGVGVGVGQPGHFVGDPCLAPVRAQQVEQAGVDDAQVRDVGEGVADLLVGQRTARPIGEARRFVDTRFGQLGDQGFITGLFAEPADHGGDLGIENRCRKTAHQVPENLHVLARRVQNLQDRRVVHQLEQGRQVEPCGLRVDGDGVGVVIRPAEPDLHHAQFGPVRRFAHKLGIEGHEVAPARTRAKRGEGVGVGERGGCGGLV